jgi:Mg-chelatase subunit ChlI
MAYRPAFRWGMEDIINTIIMALIQKFDCFIIIEGKRGTGKSTLAYKICKGVSIKFRKS